jgi:hypothetical protein
VLAGAVAQNRTISTTAPLTGGGDLSANRTLAISAATTSATGAVQLATATEDVQGLDASKVTTAANAFARFQGMWFWDFLRNSLITNVGTGNAALATNGSSAASSSTGTTASSATIFSASLPISYGGSVGPCIIWSQPVAMLVGLQSVSVTTNGILRYFAGGASGTLTSFQTPGRRAIGFDVRNLRLWILAHNGTSLTQTDTGFDLVAVTPYYVYLYSDASGSVRAYVNGTLRGTSTGGPTTAGGVNDASAHVMQSNGTDAAACRWNVTSPIKLLLYI